MRNETKRSHITFIIRILCVWKQQKQNKQVILKDLSEIWKETKTSFYYTNCMLIACEESISNEKKIFIQNEKFCSWVKKKLKIVQKAAAVNKIQNFDIFEFFKNFFFSLKIFYYFFLFFFLFPNDRNSLFFLVWTC